MKLYTRGQLVAVGIAGVVIAAVITAFCCVKILGSVEHARDKKLEEATHEILNKNENSSVMPGNSNLAVEEQGNGDEWTTGEKPYVDEYKYDSKTLTLDSLSFSEYQNITVYENCNEAVVNITTKVTSYDWFYQPYVTDGGSGSGSIIDERGYILTNVHVIKNAEKIFVSLFDGSQYEAEVIGQDLDNDLAVIKFNPPEGVKLKVIEFGDSAKLRVGQKVIAIGNPFGLERTMTTGSVSGLGRPIQDNSTNRIIKNMIQTDAAINPGNSGGPLLDTQGKMIGINTVIVSSSGNSAGVGFAVPSETAVRIVADLMKYGKVQRGQLDATLIQLNRRIAQYAGLEISSGMMVSEVTKGGYAEKAGLRAGTEAVPYGNSYYGSGNNIIYLGGDVITQIDDVKVTSIIDYYSAMESKRPGDTITVTVFRNREYKKLSIKLSE